MVVFLIILMTILIMAIVNLIIYKMIIRNAEKKYIRPYLNNLGIYSYELKFVGLFNSGDFKENRLSFIPFFSSGYIFHNTYIFILMKKEGKDHPIRLTAKIKSLFLKIQKVEYSNA